MDESGDKNIRCDLDRDGGPRGWHLACITIKIYRDRDHDRDHDSVTVTVTVTVTVPVTVM